MQVYADWPNAYETLTTQHLKKKKFTPQTWKTAIVAFSYLLSAALCSFLSLDDM